MKQATKTATLCLLVLTFAMPAFAIHIGQEGIVTKRFEAQRQSSAGTRTFMPGDKIVFQGSEPWIEGVFVTTIKWIQRDCGVHSRDFAQELTMPTEIFNDLQRDVVWNRAEPAAEPAEPAIAPAVEPVARPEIEDDRESRGLCKGCNEHVYTDQQRIKDDDGFYWHQRCDETRIAPAARRARAEPEPVARQQHIIVMRHADRADDDPHYKAADGRQFDPVLGSNAGNTIDAAVRSLEKQGVRIHRIVSSPMRRCVETAIGVRQRLTDLTEGSYDSFRRVEVDVGLMEMRNRSKFGGARVMPADAVVEDNVLRAYGVDHVYREFKIGEFVDDHQYEYARFRAEVERIANCYPAENILFVTHGDAVVACAEQTPQTAGMLIIPSEDDGYCSATHITRQSGRDNQLVYWKNREGDEATVGYKLNQISE